ARIAPFITVSVLAGCDRDSGVPVATSRSLQTSTPLVATVRHAPTVNSRIDGSIRQLLGENVVLNGDSIVNGDLLVPGSPTVSVKGGQATFGGLVVGNGSALPNNY